MSRVWVDTSLLLRLLRNDHPDLSPRAKSFLARAEAGEFSLVLTPVVLAEAAWILTEAYDLSPKKVASAMQKMLSNPGWQVLEEGVVLRTLERMESTSEPFVEAYRVSQAKQQGEALASYNPDKKLGVLQIRIE